MLRIFFESTNRIPTVLLIFIWSTYKSTKAHSIDQHHNIQKPYITGVYWDFSRMWGAM